MIIEKLIHNSFALIFPLVLTDHEVKVNYLCYVRYAATMGLLGLIYANNKLVHENKGSIWKTYKIVSSNVLRFAGLYMACNTFLHIEDYKGSSAFIFSVIIFYLYGVFFRQIIKKTGLSDFIFTIFITQMLLSLSEEIAYQEFNFKTMALFSPINLLCFSVQITFHAYINETPTRKARLNANQQNFLSAYKILGKEDSFRLMIMIFLYIWTFLMAIAYQKRSFVPLIPVIMVTNSFFNFLKYFKNQQYENSFYESKKCYILFSCFYMLIHILSYLI